MTAARIIERLHDRQIAISRPTVYRQLEKLIREGRVRKYLFDGDSVSSYQYAGGDEGGNDYYRFKCENCEGVFNMRCDEVDHVSRHILEEHAFKINDSKTVFYGKCNTCMQMRENLTAGE